MIFGNIYKGFAQFTDDELRKIDLKLRNYTILSQELKLREKQIEILEWQIKEYKKIIDKKTGWWDRHKFEVGFGCGFIFCLGSIIGTLKIVEVIK